MCRAVQCAVSHDFTVPLYPGGQTCLQLTRVVGVAASNPDRREPRRGIVDSDQDSDMVGVCQNPSFKNDVNEQRIFTVIHRGMECGVADPFVEVCLRVC